MKKVFLVRHAENPANITKEFSVHHVDYSLTPKGVEQARQTAAHFAQLIERGERIDRVVASPLRRTRETAGIIARRCGLTVDIDEALREVKVGRLETHGDLRENWILHHEIMEGWRDGNPLRRFPEGENLPELRERFSGAIARVLALTADGAIVVSHGGVVAYGTGAVADSTAHDIFTEFHNCAVSEIVFDETEDDSHGNRADTGPVTSRRGRIVSWARWDHLSGIAAQLVSGVMNT